jgi:GT2 family glycosyltransferase
MFSIIIPVKSINDYVRETVPHIQNLVGPQWELMVIPNEEEPNEWPQDARINVFSSGNVGPATKRDMGADRANGAILVFLDDDSYPDKYLLEVAQKYFLDESIVALGGPAITPPDDTFWQRVSGAVFLSKFSGGAPERYISVGKPRPVQDWPSVNLMVRRQDFLEIGGFDSPYWPGEDTKLCLDLIQKTGKTIMYVPEIKVWHHRREGLFFHLKQVGGYGLHRGYFAKMYPETSRKLKYFVPSLLVVYLATLLLTEMFSKKTCIYQYLPAIGYMAILIRIAIDVAKIERVFVAIATVPFVVLTHLYYGMNFLKGLFTQNLRSKFR